MADGTEMLDCVVDIPLPGRMLMPSDATAHLGANRHPFPAFVAGPENRLLAHTIQNVLCSEPDSNAVQTTQSSYCLLVIFGPSGTGKSHLTQGLVRYWQSRHGEESAHYTTAADFRHRLHDAARRQAELDFRAEFRGRQLLVIEDLQHLPTDDHTLQELRYTFDDYEDQGGLVVVTSTTPPITLPNLSSDVRNRLTGGLTLQLLPPGEAARARILRYAANALGRSLAEVSAQQLAHSLEGPPNQLFGAIFELCGDDQSPTVDRDSAEQWIADRAARKPTLREIIALVACHQNVPQSQLKSSSRRHSTVFARGLVVFLARELGTSSYDQIGRALGGRDHTTILHSYRKIARGCEDDPEVRNTVTNLRRILLSR